MFLNSVKSKFILYFVFFISLISTLGSLYFSEIREYVPCNLCWFQRIFMYPLVIISFVGLLRNDKGVLYSILPLSFIGIFFSSYHLYVENSSDSSSVFCDFGVSCAVKYINWFGFITIPTLCFTAFLLIIFSIFVYLFKFKK